AALVQIPALVDRDRLFHDRTQILGLGQRGDDLLVLDQGGGHVGEHGTAMLGRAVEFPMDLAVTHRSPPLPFPSAFRPPALAAPRRRNDRSRGSVMILEALG